jgi:sulfotransferase
MERVYDFVDLPRFTHDFENISFDATEFDARLGTPNLHKVQRAVRAVEPQTLLPPRPMASL